MGNIANNTPANIKASFKKPRYSITKTTHKATARPIFMKTSLAIQVRGTLATLSRIIFDRTGLSKVLTNLKRIAKIITTQKLLTK